ncbi:MAG TPA: hypothetical protein VJQ50_12420 [Terriglobales bacterium]|nr:hypothetical protein [Terriglobales bacterium]
MNRRSHFATHVLLLMMVVAWSLPGFARRQTVEELKAKLSAATPSDKPKICLEIAHRQLDAMQKAYSAGELPQGQKLLQEVVDYSQQAGDAARKSRKHIKKTEIEMRKLSRRLQDLKPTLDVDSRPPVQDAINHLEHIRTQLLMQMFSEH